MFYSLAVYLSKYFTFLNAFTYLTTRLIFAALTALFLSLFLGKKIINFLIKKQINQAIRIDGPEKHFDKKNTPTMGGIIILFSVTVSMLLWSDLTVFYSWLALLVLLGFGLVGFVDDYKKVIKKNSQGLTAKQKYFFMSAITLLVILLLYFFGKINTSLNIPFSKNVSLELGFLFLPFAFFVLTGSSNAVNLTDGLDGLAIMLVVLVASGLSVFAYLSGSSIFASYLYLPAVPNAGEMAIFAVAIAGSGLGFLWYNAYPAQIFMGDVGSLSLGASLAIIALVIEQELVFALMGGIFVIETLSVILQVTSFRLFKKRLFRMTPIHHHFELKNIPETKITIRFWIITVFLVLLGLSALKLR